MKISQKERAILSAIELRANRPLTKIKLGLPYREHTLRYFVQKLEQEEGVRRQAVINFAQLGYTEFSICFALATRGDARRPAALKRLLELPRVRSLAALAGDYEHQLLCCAEGPQALIPCADRIDAALNDCFLQRVVSMRAAETYFGRKYMMLDRSGGGAIAVIRRGQVYVPDQIDRRIINGLVQLPFKNVKTFARELGLLSTTLQYRLDRLQDHNVIAGWIYQISAAKLGVQPYRLLVSLASLNRRVREAFYLFCQRHPLVVHLAQTVGGWDFEVTLETPGSAELLAFRNLLYDTFEKNLGPVRVLTVLKEESAAGPFFDDDREPDCRAAA